MKTQTGSRACVATVPVEEQEVLHLESVCVCVWVRECVWVWVRVCEWERMCVWECVCEREWECASVIVWERMSEWVSVCERVCVWECMSEWKCVCVYVVLVVQYSMCLCHIMFLSVASLEHKMCVWISSINFFWNSSHSKKNKNTGWYYYKRTHVVM